jgi:transposase
MSSIRIRSGWIGSSSTGFWLCQKRLSQGRFRCWPRDSPGQVLAPHALAVLLSGGDYAAAGGMPQWRALA